MGESGWLMSFNAWYYSYSKCIIRDRICPPFTPFTWQDTCRVVHLFMFFYLFVFVLCFVPNVARVSGLSILDFFANQVYDPRGGGSQPLTSEDDFYIPLRISLTFSNLDLIFWFLVFSATFSYIMATSFSGGRSQYPERTTDHGQVTG